MKRHSISPSAPLPTRSTAWNGIIQMQVFCFSENWSWNIWKDASGLSWVLFRLWYPLLRFGVLLKSWFWQSLSPLLSTSGLVWCHSFHNGFGQSGMYSTSILFFYVLSNEKSTEMLIMHFRGLPSLCSCKALCSHERRTHEPAACTSWLEELLQFPKALKFMSEIIVVASWGLWVVLEARVSFSHAHKEFPSLWAMDPL